MNCSYGITPNLLLKQFPSNDDIVGNINYYVSKSYDPTNISHILKENVPVYNNSAYTMTNNMYLLDAQTISSSAFSILNTPVVLINIINEILKNIKTYPQFLKIFTEKIQININTFISILMFQLNRLFLMQKSILFDNNAPSTNKVSGYFWTNSNIYESNIVSFNKYEYTNFYPSWNGIIKNSSIKKYNRCPLQLGDGAGTTIDNSSIVHLIRSIQYIESDKSQIFEIVYFENGEYPNNITTFFQNETNGFNTDLSNLFGVVDSSTQYIKDNVLYNTKVFGIPLFGGELPILNPIIFETNTFNNYISNPKNQLYINYDKNIYGQLSDDETGVRVSYFTNVKTVNNKEMDIKEGWTFNITVISTFSHLKLEPLPQKNTKQFVNESNVYKKLIAQLQTLDNDINFISKI